MKIKVSERAVFARLNRRLNRENLLLKKCRSNARDYQKLGDYFIVDMKMNAVVDMDIGLEAHCKKYGLLKEYEVLIRRGR